MIDFSNINSFAAGQRESFEELICVLAKREKPKEGKDYQRIEGSGGDGGVEAIWVLSNGEKIGYQGKFFPSLGNSQWSQIDKSVKRALEVHPELKRYIVAMSCNLTNTLSAQRRGTSGWEKWDARVLKWKGWAITKGIEIEFEPWTATDLAEKLLRADNVSIVEHWFGLKVLNDAWFQNHIEVAIRVLDERFNPDDHVEVSIENVFDAMVRGPSLTKHITEGFSEFLNTRVPNIGFLEKEQEPDEVLIETTKTAWDKVASFRHSFPVDFEVSWNIASVKTSLDNLRKAIWNLERQYMSIDRESEDKETLNDFMRSLRKLSSSCNTLDDIFDKKTFLAESLQCAIIYGAAGVGKSHVFGRIAEQRTKDDLPTVLLLGQNFSDSNFWNQIGGQLGLGNGSAESVLGVLNAVGERKGVRTLILFDAINEGIGARYWMQRLPELTFTLQKYPNISMALSCREEYLPYAIPRSLSDSLPKFQIIGFSTAEEMEAAAIQYLDKKGIARPNTPWLSPEFSNPLFLKSASEAIESKGGTEFPRGLHGISELMALYLDALSWRTSASGSDPKQIANSVKKLVQRIAEKMANSGCDFIAYDYAIMLTNDCFEGMQPPDGKSWLNILIEASLFRRDPPPFYDDIDPLNPPGELIRFSFQRFQDHLMANSLVQSVKGTQIDAALNRNGTLSFLFYDGDPENGFRYEYAGIIGSLCTIYPEKLGVEFPKTLPNWQSFWVAGPILQEAFAESCKWRKTDAFSEPTGELLNNLDDQWVDKLGLLLEVSITLSHPWNAFYLHSWLKSLSMPERDESWTRWINWTSMEEHNQIERIVSWSMSILGRKADVGHLELASLVLVWSLSSSHKTLRDRATKALTTVMLKHSSVFDLLLENINSCDDPYVVERLYAAAFGACCLDQTPERLRSYSRQVYEKVFAGGQPPIALLTRDYALGIIELAASRDSLTCEFDIESCYPPHGSNAPEFNLTKAQVEQLAVDRGGKDIFRSASSEWGDFGKYSIPGRVSSFLTTPLAELAPISRKELKLVFYDEVISCDPERLKALKKHETLEAASKPTIFQNHKKKMKQEEQQKQALDYEKSRLALRKQLEDLLSPVEVERLSKEYFGEGRCHADYDLVSVQQCRLWITRRAYELGWTSELFPNDGSGTNYSRYENDLERIGKKYQRIALDEIQARLADNFWMMQGWPEKPSVYRYSHCDYRRNLEPTILPTEARVATPDIGADHWIDQPIVRLPEVSEENLEEWPFEQDPTLGMKEKLVRIDDDHKRWLVLYDHVRDSNDYSEQEGASGHSARIEEFRFFYCLFLRSSKVGSFVEFLKTERSLDVHSFEPTDFTDGPYLLEAYWRDTWSSDKFSGNLYKAPEGCDFAKPITNYLWESHLDKTLPEGFTNYMPQMWFAKELDLFASPKGPHLWTDETGNNVVQSAEPFGDKTAVVIDEVKLEGYAKAFDVEPVWLMIAERTTWPRASTKKFCCRRSEGVVWREKGVWKQVGWNEDTSR